MMRNAFEHNEPEITEEDFVDLSGSLFSVLPPLAEGYKYELKTMGTRSVVIVVEI